MKAAALQFCSAPEVVACVIPGARSAAEAAENARLMARPVPAGFWAALRAQGLIPDAAPTPA
jgi:D-threo-aldose 1-dehydrogenase